MASGAFGALGSLASTAVGSDATITVGTGPGAYSVTLFLEKGDYVQTFAASDGNLKRHLLEYNFTGHLVKQAAHGL